MTAPSDDSARRPTDAPPPDMVPRRRYERERRAREEAEALLEAKSRELFEANESLERQVAERTETLRRAVAAAEEAGAMRARFLAVMSHEIRTPLGGLLGMLDLLQTEPLPPGAQKLIAAALASADSLKRVVNDVLDLSTLDAGKMRFESEPVDLRALARGVVALLGPRATAKGLTATVAIDDGVPARFLGDATRLRQVLSNLMDNAVKFSDQGAVSLTAERRRGAEGDRLRVTVRDQGPGVAEADRPRLFADFSQLDSGLAKRAEGAGLGLSICRRIVEGLGGAIGVETAEGGGAAFWFEIPLRPVETAAAPPRSPGPNEGPPRRILFGLRLLVAEDNAVNRELVAHYLARLGAARDFAENGAEAIAMAARRRYDLILMDVAMPEVDGVSAALAIREGDGPSRAAPIVAFTAHVTQAVQAECLEAGMVEVLPKPLAFDALAAALARHAGRSGADAPRGEAPDLSPALREDAGRRIARMRDALAGGDREGVRAEAHAIRGAAGLLGAEAAHEIAAALEEGAVHLEPADIDEALDDLATALDAPQIARPRSDDRRAPS